MDWEIRKVDSMNQAFFPKHVSRVKAVVRLLTFFLFCSSFPLYFLPMPDQEFYLLLVTLSRINKDPALTRILELLSLFFPKSEKRGGVVIIKITVFYTLLPDQYF